MWESIQLSIPDLILLAVAGVFTGIINTLAGSGSLITLPIFIFICGLPPSVANATNRIGVLMQSLVGTGKYYKTMPEIFKGSAWLTIPAVLGALLGSKIAVGLNEEVMRFTLGGLMVLMLFILLLKPQSWLKTGTAGGENRKTWKSILIFFAIGIYGGFLQAGVGLFLLAAMVLVSNYSLKQANGLKLMLVLFFTIPSLILFFYYGKVHVFYGVLMGVFQAIGAWLGVRFVSKIDNADKWIYRLLIVIVAVSALKFFIY